MDDIIALQYIIIPFLSFIPALFFAKSFIKNKIGYNGFILILLIWFYNIFGFIRFGFFLLGSDEDKFIRYAEEYGAFNLYHPLSLYFTIVLYLIFALSYGFGCYTFKGNKAINFYNDENRFLSRNFFEANIFLALISFLLSIFIIFETIHLIIFDNGNLSSYRTISEGIDNYYLHSVLFRISCILILFSFSVSDTKFRIIITFTLTLMMLTLMTILGQRNEMALLFLGFFLISLNRKKISKNFLFGTILSLTFLRFIEIIRAESFIGLLNDVDIPFQLLLSLLTFWYPLFFGGETAFPHFSNLSIIHLDLFVSPLERFHFWLMALIPNTFGIDRGPSAYLIMKDALGLPDGRGYTISVISSSVYSFGILGSIIFIILFGLLSGLITARLYQFSKSLSFWRSHTFSVAVATFIGYLFIINRSGIDNMKSLIFFTLFVIFYGRISTFKIHL